MAALSSWRLVCARRLGPCVHQFNPRHAKRSDNAVRSGGNAAIKEGSNILSGAAGSLGNSLDNLLGMVAKRVGAKDVLPFLLFGSAFTLLAWVIASVTLGRLFRWQEINVPELIALLIGGIAAGLFFWIISLQKVGHPVIGYHSNFKWLEADNPLLWRTELYACCGVPLFLLVFLVGATFFVGVSSFSARIEDEDREWWSRLGAWVLIVVIAWTV